MIDLEALNQRVLSCVCKALRLMNLLIRCVVLLLYVPPGSRRWDLAMQMWRQKQYFEPEVFQMRPL